MRYSRAVLVTALLMLVVFFATALSLFANGPANAADRTKVSVTHKGAYVQPTDPALYVGTETCKTCHEDKFKSFEETRHYATEMNGKKGPAWQGCEACHGPGKAHVDGGGDKTKIFAFRAGTPMEMSARCLTCHSLGDGQINFQRSEHARSEVGCL